ncbi:MAG: hypothetical protein P9M14_17555 [Candidatus Alcyoniella australis]|nr:hypothetical protein [Candidatus Alcyoniella australis]
MSMIQPRRQRTSAQSRKLRIIGMIVVACLTPLCCLALYAGRVAQDEQLRTWQQANLLLAQGLSAGDCRVIAQAGEGYDEALSALRLYGNPVPRARVVFRASLARRLSQVCGSDLDQRLQQAQQTVDLNPGNAELLLELAVVQLARGELIDATLSAQQALALGDDQRAAHELLALLDELQAYRDSSD